MDGYLALAAILSGWLAGAAVNYLSDVLPRTRRLSKPVCLACGEGFPLRNYLFWPRRCPACGHRRSWRAWVVEFLFISAGLWIMFQPPSGLNFPVWMAVLAYFGVVVVIDLEHRLILHPVSLVGAFLGLGVGSALRGVTVTVIGGVAGFASMMVLYLLGNLFMRWLARRRGRTMEEEALGFGDVNFSGVLGLMLGWPGIAAGLVLTILLAGVGSLIYLGFMVAARRYHPELAIAYGPFLVASGIILLYF